MTDRAGAACFPSAVKNALLEWKETCCQEEQSQAKGAEEDPSSEPLARTEGAILETFIARESCLLRAVCRNGLGWALKARAVFDAEEPVWSLLSSHWIN